MNKQIIISISREFGADGTRTGQKVAEKLGIPFLDKELMGDIINASDVQLKDFFKYDFKPANHLLSRRIGDYSNSLEEYAANKIFEFIKKEADNGESFVVIGRCSDYILKDNPNCLSFFIRTDKSIRAKRIAEFLDLSNRKAQEMMRTIDKRRRAYHDYYCKTKWGYSDAYDFILDSSKLGPDSTAEVIYQLALIFKQQCQQNK